MTIQSAFPDWVVALANPPACPCKQSMLYSGCYCAIRKARKEAQAAKTKAKREGGA